MKFSTFALASVAAMAASYAPAAEATGMVLKDPNGSTFPACYDVSGDIHGMAKLLLGWDEGRALRGDRKLPSCPPSNWCRTNCAGFPPGSCQLAYPWCAPCRRLQEDTPSVAVLSEVTGQKCEEANEAFHLAFTEIEKTECAQELLGVGKWKCYTVDNSP